jgi:hypothetical protein
MVILAWSNPQTDNPRSSYSPHYLVSRQRRGGRYAGVAYVDPVCTWVSLAQRMPVRIAIGNVPPGAPLVSGLTATVTIREGKDAEIGTLLQESDALLRINRGSVGAVRRHSRPLSSSR